MLVVTTPTIAGHDIVRVIGPVMAARSHTKWKANSQYNRLKFAMSGSLEDLIQEAWSLHANAIVGLSFSANNSSGGSEVFGGTSDAVILLGTAVVVAPKVTSTKVCPACCEDVRTQATKCRFCGERLSTD